MSVTTYQCGACGHTALFAGNCPLCLKSRRYIPMRPLGLGGAVPLSMVRADTLPRLVIPGFPRIESAMNGGFVRGTVTVLYGGAGLGKTTLCLKLTDRIVRVYRSALYCSTEQPPEHLLMSAGVRLHLTQSPMLVAYETSIDSLLNVLRHVAVPFAVIDSIANLAHDESLATITARLVEAARSINTALLCVLHETKDGDYNAPRLVEHLVDCMVRLSDGATDDMRPTLDWTVIGKYRFGPIDRTAHLYFDEERLPYDPDASRSADPDQRD